MCDLTLDELKEAYAESNPKSRAAYEAAAEYIPGGISGNVRFVAPFPLYMKKGEGAWLTDFDGHRYVDYVLSYGPLIHGHGNAYVRQAAESYLAEHGTWLYGASHELELEFAKLIHSYFPSMEMMRFTNSGTEANLLAVRLARAFTGRRRIAKFEGHYHGGLNALLISTGPKLQMAGDAKKPNSVPESAGIAKDELQDTIVLPFNDLSAAKQILEEHCEEIAAVILEPFQGGTIPATQEFIHGLREITKRLGVLLVMDEVKTGFCISMNGAQGYYGVIPDLTALGKIVGGGMPIGVLGGRRDIMQMIAPGGSYLPGIGLKHTEKVENLYHSGTYNAHPLILAMGKASIELLAQKFDALVENTERLKRGIKKSYASHGIHVLTPGVGALFNVYVTDKDEIRNYRDTKDCDLILRKAMDYALVLEGVYNKPGKRYNISTAHTKDVIEFTLKAFERAFRRVGKAYEVDMK